MSPSKKSVLVLGVAALGLGIYGAGAALAHYEGPPYEVLKSDGKFEWRRYKPRIVASVDVEGEYRQSMNKGFGILAGYIFGKNVSRSKVAMTSPVLVASADSQASLKSERQGEIEKIAMTAPVVVENEPGREAMTMRFFMPEKYSLADLPTPVDERIRLSTLPEQTFVVVRFSGSWKQSEFDKRAKELQTYAAGAGLKVTGEPASAFYNPPFTPPFLRRNEVLLPVQIESGAGNDSLKP
ncbi:MAG: heme-binding protein [Candidatus Obscuribacter sp.]|nr:heme-binding protein [Candidatus Obscuribacter sp.]MBK9278201.1 heme-binding protein [Candidatus Obscuribacter sp.]MBL8081185.1 heme-binding protein [Candidatus Obscuribacter sp.]